jgi:DNA polymerase-1
LEHRFQLVVNRISDNGFCFNVNRANNLLSTVNKELEKLDKEILREFPPKLKMIREIHPKETKYGTLSRTDFRWVQGGDLSEFNGGPFCRCGFSEFNPSSHKQIVSVLAKAGWKPTDKTQTHIDTERDISRLKRDRKKDNSLDISNLSAKLKILEVSGWKVNENNLATLPDDAPSSARSLARRILYESRRRTLTEWLGLVNHDDGRIHGRFYGIGAWTHRMAHQQPNTANIPNEFDLNGNKKLLGKELRSLWQAPRNRLLVGVDAEGIQLRIFAHYINDEEFTNALVRGSKDDKTDPHSLNQRVLGEVCKTRAAAKRFVYALLLGAGIGKLAQILETDQRTAEEALGRLLERYTGFARLKEEVIPLDARKGWFVGLDGRRVRIPGETVGERRHLCMSGYLQNGESIIMKKACLKWEATLLKEFNSKLVGFIHDEWQTETPNDLAQAIRVAEVQSQSLAMVGEELGLRCPLAGSYWNDDHKDYTIGTNWSVTH